jgi:phage-related protein
MSAWKVEFLEEALGEFKDLPAEIRARFQRIFSLVADMGQDALCMPHARHIQGRIWEMRAKGRDGIGAARGCCPIFHQENAEDAAKRNPVGPETMWR